MKLSLVGLVFMLFTFYGIVFSSGGRRNTFPDIIQDGNSVVSAQGKITTTVPSGWTVSSTNIPGAKLLESVFFTDTKNGWVGGPGAIYKTVDGGKTWSPVNIDIPKRSAVAGIYFANPSIGWITVVLRAPTEVPDIVGSEFFVMFTNDGGHSWSEQYHATDAIPVKMAFLNDRIGWLTAVQVVKTANYALINLVMYTNDQGKNWSDRSLGLNKEYAKIDRKFPDKVIAIIPDGTHSATVLGGDGDMFTTTDDGLTWQSAGRAPGSHMYRDLHSFGKKANGEIWVAGGTRALEGESGVIAVKHGTESWVKYEIAGYVTGVKYLSDDRFVACGQETIKKKFKGAVMISSDDGRNWAILYLSPDNGPIRELFAVDASHIWAVGNDGLVVRLESSQ